MAPLSPVAPWLGTSQCRKKSEQTGRELWSGVFDNHSHVHTPPTHHHLHHYSTSSFTPRRQNSSMIPVPCALLFYVNCSPYITKTRLCKAVFASGIPKSFETLFCGEVNRRMQMCDVIDEGGWTEGSTIKAVVRKPCVIPDSKVSEGMMA